jgi:hypothetical protein
MYSVNCCCVEKQIKSASLHESLLKYTANRVFYWEKETVLSKFKVL